MQPAADGHKKKEYSDQDIHERVLLLVLTQVVTSSFVLIDKSTTKHWTLSIADHGGRQQSSVCAISAVDIWFLYSPSDHDLSTGLVKHLLHVTTHTEIMPLFRLKELLFTCHGVDVGKY